MSLSMAPSGEDVIVWLILYQKWDRVLALLARFVCSSSVSSAIKKVKTFEIEMIILQGLFITIVSLDSAGT